MEALKLDSYEPINRFVQEEKKRYANNVIDLKSTIIKEYVNSLTHFDEMFNEYKTYIQSSNHYSLNKHAILINKLKSAIEDLLNSFKKQHNMRNNSSANNFLFLGILKDMNTAIEMSEKVFNVLAEEALQDADIENIKIFQMHK